MAKNAYESNIGLKLDQGDHTYKFKLCDTGVLSALVQWHIHEKCKAHVSSKLDLKDVPAGKVAKVPVGVHFEFNY